MIDAVGAIAPDSLVGGRYRVLGLIGKGGMGAVYAARNLKSERAVALKIIKAGVEHTPEQRRRFLREAKAATAIQHPNVIEVLDVFEEPDGTLVMVMELLQGETLKELRVRCGALKLREAAVLFLPLVDALVAAHAKGIVHRDLKPENVFLAKTSSGAGEPTPKLLDFGIAKVVDPATLTSETQGAPTATGALLGTPHYMSYEQAMSEKDIDQRADVWAVGVMLFELLTGRRPIEFDNLGEMYTQFLTGSIPSIRELVPELPDDVARVIDGCLRKDRAERLGGLEQVRDTLARYTDAGVEGAGAGGRVVVETSTAARLSSTTAAAITDRDLRLPESMRPLGRRRMGTLAAVAIVVALLVGYALLAPTGAGPAAEPADATEPVEPQAPLVPVDGPGVDGHTGRQTQGEAPASTATPSAPAIKTLASSRPHLASPSALAPAASSAMTPAPKRTAKGIAEDLPY